jgi:class 3 adenylate cyclase/predicted ATPase
VRCSVCGSENHDAAKFCHECSAPLLLRCPACGVANRTPAKFCGQCAAALDVNSLLPGPQRQITQHTIALTAPIDSRNIKGERRHLTVLFCDLMDSTRIAAHLDPEDWREVVTAYHSSATDAVGRFGGYVAQLLGDGLLVFFGYPQAHEDDPERAVLAGMAILDAMATLNEHIASHQSIRLAVRIGIHSGPVVVDESSNKGASVFGEVPNVASRVETSAAPDTVMISGAVHHLVSGLFVVEDRGEQPLKGVENPIRLYRVIQPSGARGRLAAAAVRGLTPFTGRQDELHLLSSRWDLACEGESQVMLVVGEAGIGKSRLVQRFHELVADTPHTWVECVAAALHQNTPFYAIADLLEQGFKWRGEQTTEERIAGLEASLKLAGLNTSDAMPLIAPLVSLPIAERYASPQIPPDQQRKRLLATIAAWTLGTARIQPLVIVIEDLHWADPSTLEVIQVLVEQNAMAPLLVICTARPEFRTPWPMRAHHSQLTLNRLNARNAREMVSQLASHATLAPNMVEAVVERSGGVPLFVEELTRALVAGADFNPAMREIPATLRDSLMARLDRLGEAREIAQVAAVIGHDFTWKMLSAIAGIEDEKLAAALKKLAEAGLLLEQGVPPESNYRFRHALIQDTAYQSLLRSKRQSFHLRITEALVKRLSGTAAQPELLAYHYGEAGLVQKAIEQWQFAGQLAIQRSANTEAVSHLTRGLELLHAQKETPEVCEQELALHLALGPPLIATKGFASPEVGKVYSRALELCKRDGQVPELFSVLWGSWAFHTAGAEHKVAHELAEQCLHLAEEMQNPVLVLEAHHALGVTLTGLAEFAKGLEHLNQVIGSYDPALHGSMAFLFGQDPKIVCLSQAAWTLWIHGYPDQALERNHEAITMARKLSHPYSLAAALNFGAIVYQLCQNERAVREYAEAAVALSDEQGFALWKPWGLVLKGWATTQRGQLADGIAQMRDGITAYRATHAKVMVPYFLGLLAEAFGNAGQAAEGLSILVEAQELAEESHEYWWNTELSRVKGELTLMSTEGQRPFSKDQIYAEECFSQARSIATNQSAKSLELRTAMSLSRLWQKQGKAVEARSILAEIFGWFKEGSETPDLRAAKELLESLWVYTDNQQGNY